MLLSELLADRGLKAADVAAQLAEHGIAVTSGPREGQPFTANDVSRRVSREVPKSWREALGVEASTLPRVEGGGAPGGSETQTSSSRRETPPKRPAEAQIEVVDAAGAKKRIAWAYKFVGTGLAAGSGSPGVAHVWADPSDGLAQMWLDAAARVVTAASAGGPMGELVAAHVYLAGASAYVLGAGIPGGDAVFAKYSKYRPTVHPTVAANGAAPPPPPAPEAPAEPIVVPVSAE
jgi:hypothetical protein